MDTIKKEDNLYSNIKAYNKDGIFIFRCRSSLANWYLKRNLAIVVNNNPLEIKLTFETKGLGNLGDDYLLSYKIPQCVVCGTKNNLTHHHVVPRCYRKYFPREIQKNWMDILLLCADCHKKCEKSAEILHQYYSELCGIPYNNIEIGHLKNIIRKARTLLKYASVIPYDRKKIIEEEIKKYFNLKEITKDFLVEISSKKYKSNKVISHAEAVIKNMNVDLNEFCRKWRYHFLEVMKPKFLSQYWNSDKDIVLSEENQLKLSKFLNELEDFKKLGNNWNNYKSNSPTEVSIHNAKIFLLAMFNKEQIPERIELSSLGGICITWKSANYNDNLKIFHIEFYNSGSMFYMVCKDKEDKDEILVKEVKTSFDNIIDETIEYFEL